VLRDKLGRAVRCFCGLVVIMTVGAFSLRIMIVMLMFKSGEKVVHPVRLRRDEKEEKE